MRLVFGRPFRGTAPKYDPRLLPEGFGQTARNVALRGGALKPIKASALQSITLSPGGSASSPVRAIYLYEDLYWLNWTNEVHVRPGPLATDALKRLYWTDDASADGGKPKKGDFTTLTDSNPNGPLPFGYYRMGVKAPTAAPTAGVHVLGTSAELVDVAYVYTLVSSWGEESAPSPPLLVENVPLDTWDGVGTTYLRLTGLETDPGSPYNITGGVKRIYRTQTGSVSGVDPYLFVAEIALATTVYNDYITAANLGEEIPSYRIENGVIVTWDEPPTGLSGLTSFPNGVMAGFSGRTVYFSEPYQPYAWPAAYARDLDADIQAIGAVGLDLIVATKGYPYIFTGAHPLQMVSSRIGIQQSCESAQSLAEGRSGVAYASPDGAMFLGSGESRILTDPVMTRTEWRDYIPSSMRGAIHDGLLFLFYEKTDGETGALILDPESPETFLTTTSLHATAVYVDVKRDTMYLVVGGAVYAWDADDGVNLTYLWKSSVQRTPPTSFGAAKLEGDSGLFLSDTQVAAYQAILAAAQAANAVVFANSPGSVDGFAVDEFELNGDGMLGLPVTPPGVATFRYYADQVLKFEASARAGDAFRLPTGFLSREHEIEIEGNVRIAGAALGTTIQELG